MQRQPVKTFLRFGTHFVSWITSNPSAEGNMVQSGRATKGANRAPRVRAEPGDRSPARRGLRVALGRRQPARVPAPRGGLLRGGTLCGGRPGAEDQDDPRV